MIVEGLLTSTDKNGTLNVAPMGPIVHGDFQSLTLRPWAGSTTFQNLLETKQAVFHIVDGVSVIAEAAVRRLTTVPATIPAEHISGRILDDCCRWFELQIVETDTTHERSEMTAEIIHSGTRRLFRGFNRARHAVIEAAILATRLHLLARDEVECAMDLLTPAVKKTGGDEEFAAYEMLEQHIAQFYRQRPST